MLGCIYPVDGVCPLHHKKQIYKTGEKKKRKNIYVRVCMYICIYVYIHTQKISKNQGHTAMKRTNFFYICAMQRELSDGLKLMFVLSEALWQRCHFIYYLSLGQLCISRHWAFRYKLHRLFLWTVQLNSTFCYYNSWASLNCMLEQGGQRSEVMTHHYNEVCIGTSPAWESTDGPRA